MRPWLLLTLVCAVLSLVACRSEGSCESENDCVEQDDSGYDLVWQCVESRCTGLPCETSVDCAMGTHCKALPPSAEGLESLHYCAEGCQRDGDCAAGTFCREGVCEAKQCRNGHLDCELAEICEGGLCVHAGPPFCQDCNPNFNEIDPGDSLDSCDQTFVGHPTCGAGNFCWNLPHGPSCGVPCVDNSDCPGGFSCGQALYSAPACPNDFVSMGRFCVTDFCFVGR